MPSATIDALLTLGLGVRRGRRWPAASSSSGLAGADAAHLLDAVRA